MREALPESESPRSRILAYLIGSGIVTFIMLALVVPLVRAEGQFLGSRRLLDAMQAVGLARPGRVCVPRPYVSLAILGQRTAAPPG
jgi:hypothetical protein